MSRFHARMKLRTSALLIALALMAPAAAPALAQGYPAAPATPAATPATVAPSKLGIKINGTLLAPGEVLQTLMGLCGPPDHVTAVRGKQPADDFVLFSYDSYGISVHIHNQNNQNNIVGAIVVTHTDVVLDGVPFKLGDDYKSVMQIWGQPDRQEPGFMAYWKRGVYVGVGENGKVSSITLTEPGKMDDHGPKAPAQG